MMAQRDSAIDLMRAIDELRKAQDEVCRRTWGGVGAPLHLEARRDRAAQRVNDAVRSIVAGGAGQ